MEHDRWVYERLSDGWIYGEMKDVDRKISPYLIFYDKLPEPTKDLDREPIKNLPKLLASFGMRIIKDQSDKPLN